MVRRLLVVFDQSLTMVDSSWRVRNFLRSLACRSIPTRHLLMLNGLGTLLGGFCVVVVGNSFVICGCLGPGDHFLQGTLGDLLLGIDNKRVAKSNTHSQHRNDDRTDQ